MAPTVRPRNATEERSTFFIVRIHLGKPPLLLL
jgi:hypothetical protein